MTLDDIGGELLYCDAEMCPSLFANNCPGPDVCLKRVKGVHIFLCAPDSDEAFYIVTLQPRWH